MNHESAFCGHLGTKKAEVRILLNLFWPGLVFIPSIDTPFKSVVVDIVGPIAPPSEAGQRYILDSSTQEDYYRGHSCGSIRHIKWRGYS